MVAEDQLYYVQFNVQSYPTYVSQTGFFNW